MNAAAASHRYAVRRDRLRRHLRKHHLPPMLVSHPVHVHYLTGFTGDSTHLLMLADRDLLVSDFRYREQIAEECPDVELEVRALQITLWECTARRIEQSGARAAAFESSAVSVAELELLQSHAPS